VRFPFGGHRVAECGRRGGIGYSRLRHKIRREDNCFAKIGKL
jgi:hypothetical protein